MIGKSLCRLLQTCGDFIFEKNENSLNLCVFFSRLLGLKPGFFLFQIFTSCSRGLVTHDHYRPLIPAPLAEGTVLIVRGNDQNCNHHRLLSTHGGLRPGRPPPWGDLKEFPQSSSSPWDLFSSLQVSSPHHANPSRRI